MALTLDQVNKRKKSANKKETATRAAEPAANPQLELDTKRAVRPWSQDPVPKRPKRSALRADAYLSTEWMELQESPIFWVDLSQDSRLIELQNSVNRFEEKCIRWLDTSFDVVDRARVLIRALPATFFPLPLLKRHR